MSSRVNTERVKVISKITKIWFLVFLGSKIYLQEITRAKI